MYVDIQNEQFKKTPPWESELPKCVPSCDSGIVSADRGGASYMIFKRVPSFDEIRQDWYCQNSYSSYHELPNRPGVYAIIATNLDVYSDNMNDKELIYIGSTNNLKNRYNGHEVMKVASILVPDFHFGFYWTECENYIEFEKMLIKKFNPKLNKFHNHV